MTLTERRLDLIEAALRWEAVGKFHRSKGPAHNVDDEGYHHTEEDGKLSPCTACRAEKRLSRAAKAYSEALQEAVRKGFEKART